MRLARASWLATMPWRARTGAGCAAAIAAVSRSAIVEPNEAVVKLRRSLMAHRSRGLLLPSPQKAAFGRRLIGEERRREASVMRSERRGGWRAKRAGWGPSTD